MSEKSEIVFMQVRLLRIASEKWHTTIQKTSKIFEKYGILKFIEDCYGIFHTEGDEAVFDEICVVLEHKGGRYQCRNYVMECFCTMEVIR
jgi:hypothetical protein